MRTQTKADVMKQAHALKAELFAPTFAEALAIAWEKAREVEKEYAEAVSKLRRDMAYIKLDDYGNLEKFNTEEEVADFIQKTLELRGFPGERVSSKHNLQTFRLSPLEVFEVNTYDHGSFYTIFSVFIKKG